MCPKAAPTRSDRRVAGDSQITFNSLFLLSPIARLLRPESVACFPPAPFLPPVSSAILVTSAQAHRRILLNRYYYGKNGQEEDRRPRRFSHVTSHPSSDVTSSMSTLKGNKQAICAFKFLLHTLDDSDEKHQPDDDQLLSPRRCEDCHHRQRDEWCQITSPGARISRNTDPDLLDATNANQSNLLARKKITLGLIASNKAKLVDLHDALASSKPSLKGKKRVRFSAKSTPQMVSLAPLLHVDPFPDPPCVFKPLGFWAFPCVLYASLIIHYNYTSNLLCLNRSFIFGVRP